MTKLTPKQESFCQQYILTGNASEAYRLAYDCKNMKPETINRNAKALLDDNKIATRIERLQTENKKRFEIDVDWKKQQLVKDIENCRPLSIEELRELFDGAVDEEGNIELAVQQRLKQTSATAVERAINQLCLIDGDHAPTKVENKNVTDWSKIIEEADKRLEEHRNKQSKSDPDYEH